jgi:RNA polymerase sigma-B factor
MLSAAEEAELTACVKQGNSSLERLLSELVPCLLASLRQPGCTPFGSGRLDPAIRDGLRDALLEQCRRDGPGDGLAARALVRIQDKVSAFIDESAEEGEGAPFDGTLWVKGHLTSDLLASCLQNPEVARTWPALRRWAEAVRRLVETHLSLATTIAKIHKGRGLEFDDMRQIAALGLQKAAENFDPDQGAPFRAYATTVIRHDLAGALRTIRGGTAHSARHQTVFRCEERRLAQTLGRRPADTEVFESLGWGKTKRQNVGQGFVTSRTESLDFNKEATGELPRDPHAADPAAEAENRENLEILHATLARLDDVERQVINLRHIGPETMTQEETANRLNMPLSRVRKIEASGLGKIRQSFKDNAAPVWRTPRG